MNPVGIVPSQLAHRLASGPAVGSVELAPRLVGLIPPIEAKVARGTWMIAATWAPFDRLLALVEQEIASTVIMA
ncbi:hypothetical protein PGT21_034214 [Puccinia graminis f. sp. tritici]|uniref:Uncharacterized protein n=1 Tax=Puccinia graminis f. sp. tritici TaxID=56615 RepID=A0A5B0PPR5_PUCGR|nr:hypothetical protein PGT21_034214 [Puccinia graminis f. sp. tritici]